MQSQFFARHSCFELRYFNRFELEEEGRSYGVNMGVALSMMGWSAVCHVECFFRRAYGTRGRKASLLLTRKPLPVIQISRGALLA